ncbi:hypothetical protein TNCT_33241 [Trichonephila clavata]|uniref:Uncharacterized protein n=1 Tax=Trichonephila clavata TaxID=2740835 RepID=A0A8X6JE89_TRICU|nr:hypothetical protein TNCT_33241 [Trichonephila clavata]
MRKWRGPGLGPPEEGDAGPGDGSPAVGRSGCEARVQVELVLEERVMNRKRRERAVLDFEIFRAAPEEGAVSCGPW